MFQTFFTNISFYPHGPNPLEKAFGFFAPIDIGFLWNESCIFQTRSNASFQFHDKNNGTYSFPRQRRYTHPFKFRVSVITDKNHAIDSFLQSHIVLLNHSITLAGRSRISHCCHSPTDKPTAP
jgi:hypothetical protein